MPGDKKVEALDLQGLPSGGDSWTRTNDPIDVNDVLYRLSHATMLSYFRPTSPVEHLEQFVLPTEPCDFLAKKPYRQATKPCHRRMASLVEQAVNSDKSRTCE